MGKPSAENYLKDALPGQKQEKKPTVIQDNMLLDSETQAYQEILTMRERCQEHQDALRHRFYKYRPIFNSPHM